MYVVALPKGYGIYTFHRSHYFFTVWYYGLLRFTSAPRKLTKSEIYLPAPVINFTAKYLKIGFSFWCVLPWNHVTVSNVIPQLFFFFFLVHGYIIYNYVKSNLQT